MRISKGILRWRPLALLLLASAVLLPVRAQNRSAGRFDGKWEWRGDISWQRLALDLKVDRGKVTGTVKMGPGPGESAKPEDSWEYFFNPVVYEISNGTIQGEDTLLFEQKFKGASFDAANESSLLPDHELRYRYTGKLDGEQLVLKREIHETSGVGRGYGNQEFEIVMARPGVMPIPGKPAPTKLRATSSATFSTMDVVVRDAEGRFVPSLRKEDFQVLEGGLSLEIQSVSDPDTPWNIVFLLDMDALLLTPFAYSGSPIYAARGAEHAAETYQQLGDSVALFYHSLRSQDRLAIDLFVGNRTFPLLAWRNGGQRGTWATPHSVLPTSGTLSNMHSDLFHAIRDVLQRLRATKGRSMVVLLTDGRDARTDISELQSNTTLYHIDPFYGLFNASLEREFEQLLDEVQKSGVQFFVASVNGDRPLGTIGSWFMHEMAFVPEAPQNFPTIYQALDESLSRLARVSGGAVISHGDTPRAATAAASLAEQLALGRAYRVRYSSAATVRTATKAEIHVRNPQLRIDPVNPEFLGRPQ